MKIIGEDSKTRKYALEAGVITKELDQTESELRQKRQEGIVTSGYIENEEIRQLQTRQRQIYQKLIMVFEPWKQAIAEKLKNIQTITEVDNNQQNEQADNMHALINKLSKQEDYFNQVEAALKKHELELNNWQKNHDKVVELGGLRVLGSERHEARRIDNQLRGRAGRQGDPGVTRFYVALDDDIMRRFGGERIQGIMNWAGMDENTPIENKLISRSIENAQTRVEGYHFDTRKHLVEYDDVINNQREVIYGERRKILTGADLRSNILAMVKQEIEEAVDEHPQPAPGEEPDYSLLLSHISGMFPLPKEFTTESLTRMTRNEIKDSLIRLSQTLYEQKEKDVTSQMMRILERLVMLRVIDSLWVEHLTAVDNLRQGIGMEAMAQRDPLVAYRSRASGMFKELLDTIRHEVVEMIYKVNLVKQPASGTLGRQPAASQARPIPVASSPMAKIVGQPSGAAQGKGLDRQAAAKSIQKVGRNEPCPCGSGKKYKHCHGQ
jgi:preprotein translocase subunit SecA